MPSKQPVQFRDAASAHRAPGAGEYQGASIRTAAAHDFRDSIGGSLVRGGKKTRKISTFRIDSSPTRGATEPLILKGFFHKADPPESPYFASM